MPLINCKVEFSLKLIEKCILTTGTTASSKITDAELYVLIVPLSSEDNVKLSKLLGEGFKRPIYWNEYKVIPNKTYAANANIRKFLHSSYQSVISVFVVAYNTAGNDQISIDDYKKYFLQRVKIEN